MAGRVSVKSATGNDAITLAHEARTEAARMNNYSLPDNFASMYDKYFPQIYNFIFFRTMHKEQTEDIVSDVFLKVAENIWRFDQSRANFNTWIFTIAKHTLIDRYKSRRVHLSLDEEDSATWPSINFDEQSSLIADEQLRELYGALASIDARTREIIAMKHFACLSNRQIATELGLNESTVSTIYLRGLKHLRQLLAKTV